MRFASSFLTLKTCSHILVWLKVVEFVKSPKPRHPGAGRGPEVTEILDSGPLPSQGQAPLE